jgi:hypothetical protein
MSDLHAVPPTDEPDELDVVEDDEETPPTAVIGEMRPTAETDPVDWLDQHADVDGDDAGDDEYPHEP